MMLSEELDLIRIPIVQASDLMGLTKYSQTDHYAS